MQDGSKFGSTGCKLGVNLCKWPTGSSEQLPVCGIIWLHPRVKNAMNTHVLIIDDDTELCEMVADYLSLEGISSLSVHDGASGAETAIQQPFDAIILDVMLPRMNGFDVLREIRRSVSTPVIMLTARGEDVDRIIGLEMGADDYLPKPFNPRELIARLRAVLRRSTQENTSPDSDIQIADLHIQPSARRVALQDKALELTSTEFNILLCLAQQAGNVVSKEQLSEDALGKPLERYDRSIDMHISHLRRKLSDNAPEIVTVRGVGYQLINKAG